jgi:GNAT superfamily N-acetyltransferase
LHVEIVDLSAEYEASYFRCLEDWSDEIDAAGDHKETWYRQMTERGLRVKLALDDRDRPIGMIQYLPIEHSMAIGSDLYMILCVWVHGYKKGVGDHQGHGVGSALLSAAERDVAELGAKGVAAWGVAIPWWMRASWFKKHGYRRVDRQGMQVLMWKPFADDAVAPMWIKRGPKPQPVAGQVTISAYLCGWCPAQNLVYERARAAAAEFGDDVVFESYDTSEQSLMLGCGQCDAVYLDGRLLQKGPPPSYDRIHKKIARRVKRLRA